MALEAWASVIGGDHDAAEGERRSAPSDWTGAVVRPVVALKGFWLMGSSFGLMAEVTDLQITEAEPTACPF